MKRILLSICLIPFYCLQTNAQAFNDYYTPATIRNYVPPSPNAASLGRYAEIPVNYATGIPQISIPIFNIETGNISLPISLSYHSSGVKVEEEATWVGLGWSLNAGGVITRVVKGIPDDQYNVYCSYYSWKTGFGGSDQYFDSAGYFYSSPKITAFYNGTYEGHNYFGDDVALGRIDGDPDIFYFNFGNYTGTFIFDENRIPRLTSGNDLKIAFVQKDKLGNQSSTGLISSFMLLAEDGTKFYFDDVENTTVFPGKLYGDDLEQHTPPIPYTFTMSTFFEEEWLNYNSSWYLSRVEAANGPQEITFSYDSVESTNLSNTSQKNYYGQDHGGLGSGVGFRFIDHFSNAKTGIYQKKLTKIAWDNGYITFDANYPRIDTYLNWDNPVALTDIKIFNSNPDPIKIFHLSYSNFVSPNVPSIQSDAYYGYFRLRLDSVQESSSGLSLPPYQFLYDDSVPLPHRHSCEQDFWGYFNGNGVTNNSLIPNIYVYPDCNFSTSIYQSIYSIFPRNNGETEYLIPGTNRNSNIIFAKAGILKQINYPLGGHETFTYELNSFKLDINTILGCGLRIAKIKRYASNNDSDPEVRIFSYNNIDGTTSGLVLNVPEFAYHNYVGDPNYNENDSAVNVRPKYHVARFSAPQIGLGAEHSNCVYYQTVTFLNPGNGKTVNEYFLPVHFGVENILNASDTIYKRTNGNMFSNFPFAPNPNYDFMNGKLKSESVFTNTMKVKETRYLYEIKNFDKINAFTSKVKKTFSLSPNHDNQAFLISEGSKYHFLYAWTVLSQKTEVDFYTSSDSVKKITDYYYNSTSHKQLTRIKINSSIPSEDIEVKYTYPPDFSNSILDTMTKRNMVTYPVEQTLYKTNQVIASQFNNYDIDNSYYLLRHVYKLKITTPLTTFHPYNAIGIDSHYGNSPEISYLSYDSHSNPVSILDKNTVSTYTWGYNNTYPISETKNASISECGYTGFENNDFNGWSLLSSGFEFITAPDFVKTGIVSMKLNSNSIYKNYKVGLESNNHSGYKACVWVKGGSDAYIKLEIPGESTLFKIVNNPIGLNDSWNLIEVELPYLLYQPKISSTMQIKASCGSSGGAFFDDLRFYPQDAQMTTYTYDILIGMTSSSDINNKPTIFKYDDLGRIASIHDFLDNILKKYNYHYKL